MTVVPQWGDLCADCDKDPEKNNPRGAIKVTAEAPFRVDRMDPSNEKGCQNMVELADLQVGELMYNLRIRYKAEPMQYYTYVGEILIAANPLRNLGICTQEYMAKYKGVKFLTPDLPPHIFASAQEAYRKMVENRIDQSVIISGESGAGKSESTKHVLQYIAFAAEKPVGKVVDVNEKILATSAVLEAFGNAKTTRNDNSSRFGKFVQLEFDNGNAIAGAKLDQYLLEKSRIVQQEERERNYHIFYMMFKRMPRAQLDALHLTKFEDYRYLIGEKGINIPTAYLTKQNKDIEDEARYDEFMEKLHILGIPEDFIDGMWRVIATVVTMGQLEFVPPKGDGPCSIKNPDVLAKVVDLLQIDGAAFEKSLLGFMRGPVFSNYKLKQAQDNADAVAKQLYGRLFEIMVDDEINSLIRSTECARWIGVLDIFGFESFQSILPDHSIVTKNKFEQICINLTNEQLQKFFFDDQIPKQERIYQEERISVENIRYPKNDECINLITVPKSGLLAFLNSTTLMAETKEDYMENPEHADRAWLDECVRNYGPKGDRKEPLAPGDWKTKMEDFFGWYVKQDLKLKRDETDFFIYHYAGKVYYTTRGAVERNKDKIRDNVLEALQTSKISLVSQKIAAPVVGGRTVADKFVSSLKALMHKLDPTEKMFIRCVKPNCPMKPGGFFEDWKVLEQLISAGMGAVVQMRMAGYPVQRTKENFVETFIDLVDDKSALMSLSLDKQVEYLCKMVADAHPEEVKNPTGMAPYAVGTTKAFLKDNMFKVMQDALDAAHKAKRAKKILAIQHFQPLYRMYLAQRELPKLMEAYKRNKKRLDRIRELTAQGMSIEEAEAQFQREEIEEVKRQEKAYYDKLIQPAEKATDEAVKPVDAMLKDLDDFMAGSKEKAVAEREDCKARKKALSEARDALKKAFAEFKGCFSGLSHDEAKEQAFNRALKQLNKLTMEEREKIVADHARRADEVANAEKRRQEEIQRRKDAEIARIKAEKQAQLDEEQKAIEEELARREAERTRKLREKEAAKRALAEERERARKSKQLEAERERERQKKEEEMRRRAERKALEKERRQTERLIARTSALAGTKVKFQNLICTVRYVGRLPYKNSGDFVGIECPQKMGAEIGNNGSCLGVQIFECPEEHGLFVRGNMLHVIKPGEQEFSVGDSVWRIGSHRMGMVRYVGKVDFAVGVWIGVELLTQGAGKNDGAVRGRRYFRCAEKTGIFCKPEDLALVVPWTDTFVEVITQEFARFNDADDEESVDEEKEGEEDEEDDEDLRLKLKSIRHTVPEVADDEIQIEMPEPED